MKAMNHPSVIISPYQHLSKALQRPSITHVISILGKFDRLPWPSTGSRTTLRLEFDDTNGNSQLGDAPTVDHLRNLIEFCQHWAGVSDLLVHCRAGSSRSPAAAAIAVAAIGRSDLIERVLAAKTYHRPNQLMLKLADRLLDPSPELVARSRAIQHTAEYSEWGPVAIPLAP